MDHLKRASSPSVFIPVQMLCDNSVKENKSKAYDNPYQKYFTERGLRRKAVIEEMSRQ